MSFARIIWLQAKRGLSSPASAALTLLGPSLAVALALLMLSLSDAVLVRARLFVGNDGQGQRLFVSRPAPSLGAFALDDNEPETIDARDVKRLAHLPGVTKATPVTSLAFATQVSGGESMLGRTLSVDVLVEGLPPALVTDEAFVSLANKGEPLAALIHPQLLALYNATVAPSLGLPSLPATALLGQKGVLHVGRDRLAHRQPSRETFEVPVFIAGTSALASPLGLSLPSEDALALWKKAMGTNEPPPIKGVWLDLAPGASLIDIGQAVERFGLHVDEQSERGARALALGERAATGCAVLVWLAVALGNLQRELSLANEARQLTALLRLWGTAPSTLTLSRASLVGIRALVATGIGAALCRVALWAIATMVREIGVPLGFDVMALGPPLQMQIVWLALAFVATAGISIVAAWVAGLRPARASHKAVC